MSDLSEVPLSGGNTTSGIVRIGDTVRRPSRPQSPAMAALLTHLETKGFTAAPRYLDQDDQGRDILSYLDGDVGLPPNAFEHDSALIAAAKLLRAFHDATVGLIAKPNLPWAEPPSEAPEVICHSDFAPYNMVFRDGLPVGIFDFDLASPGPRLRDIAYLAYWMVPLGFAAKDLAHEANCDLAAGSPRLRAFATAYGYPADAALLDAVDHALGRMADKPRCAAVLGTAVANTLERTGQFAHWAAERHAFSQARDALGKNLD